MEDLTEPSEAGQRIGPYRLLQRVGVGGMGEVWLAEQLEPIRRKVALKIIKAGMDTATVMARFEMERQALAMMDHPCIAKVLDAGSTPQGRPYFVMEYVAGVSITEYSDRHRLSVSERLELFTRVCDGVQHAHQKAVIHRDLKPSNILVTEIDAQPIPKIIDFGVAKATGQRLDGQTMVTQFGQVIGTPAYMSPEQARLTGEDVDTRTDVYSLGVVLYELLVGARPFDPGESSAGSFDELRRLILETDPPRPSARITTLGEQAASLASNRQSEPRRLATVFQGDLDWILLKALEKERARRYDTVNSLRSDIQRYLRDEPVLASPPSASYRLRKLARRHKAAVTGAVAVLLVLVLGIAATTWGLLRARRAERVASAEAVQARKQAAIAEAVNKFLNDDLLAAAMPASERGVGRDVTMREVLDVATQRIDGAAQSGGSLAGEPIVESSIRMTLGRTYRELGEYEAAETQFRRVVEEREHIPEAQAEYASSLTELGLLLFRRGRYTEAESLYVRSLKIQLSLANRDSLTGVVTSFNLGTIYMRTGRYSEAESVYVPMLAKLRRVLGNEHQRTLTVVNNLGNLYQEVGRLAEAESLQTSLYAIRLRLEGPEDPGTLGIMNNLAKTYLAEGRLDKANDLLVTTLEAKRRVLGVDHPSTFTTLSALADVHQARGEYRDSERLYREALAGRVRVLGTDHPSTLESRNDLAFSLARQKRFAEGGALANASLATCQKTLGEKHSTTLTAMLMVAICQAGQGGLPDAESSLRHVLGQIEPGAIDPQFRALAEAHLGLLLGRQNRREEATSLLQEALPALPLWDAESRWILHAVIPMYQGWNATDPAGGWDTKATELRKLLVA